MGKKKQAKSLTTTEKQTKKDEKSKKTYSLTKSDATSVADGSVDSLPKVSIPDELERDIIALIQKEQQQRAPQGEVSKRLTSKKLTDVYNSLSNAGFSHKQIEGAMSNCIFYGGDLIDALDWLCLNTPNDQLPVGFSETLLREEKKRRPTFDQSLQVDAAMLPQNLMETPKAKAPVKKEEKESVKNWILQFADKDSSEEETDDKEPDPNEEYLILTAKLLDAKEQAAIAKQQWNKDEQKQLSKRIRDFMLAMEKLEKHPAFNPAVKISSIDKEDAIATKNSDVAMETSPPINSTVAEPTDNSAGDSDDECFDLGFGVMEERVAAEAPKAPVVVTKAIVRHFEYTRQQWTGKSPKQFLIDWVRKHLPRSDAPKYQKIQQQACFKCKCRVDRKKEGGMLEVCPDILCENVKEAEHLASTLALYHLCKGQSVYTLLPPPYRDIWLEWQDAENAAKKEAKQVENKPRDQFISRLMKKLQLEEGKQTGETGSGQGDVEEDTWESLADKDNWGPTVDNSSLSSKRSGRSGLTSDQLVRLLDDRQASDTFLQLLHTRSSLPVFQHRQSVMATVCRENIVVVAGETGSGKSTQVPQFILEDMIRSGQGSKCNIVCTQPRRISALSLANRVSQELGEGCPGKRDSLCGYQIRFESKKGPNTKLLYCTTGVLLRQLQLKPDLCDVTHIVIDEVHERSVESDFLLIVIKRILEKRSDLKVILMSATLDSDKFSAYFHHCPVINIPGRTYPVQIFHLEDIIEMTGYVVDEDSQYTIRANRLVQEDSATLQVTEQGGETTQVNVYWTKDDISKLDQTELSPDKYSLRTRNAVTRLNVDRINMDLVMELLNHLTKDEEFHQVDGAVLVFLPGLSDIQELYENLQSDRLFSDPNRFMVLALHSVLSSEDQSKAFTTPPAGIRKIVLATNIAETGITIPDVVFVIDTGKAKEVRYIETSQMSSLEEVFVSKANAKQRQGRAGRVRSGFCFRLFTEQMYRNFRPYTLPELLRVPLEELCLNIMKCKFGKPVDFLAQALDPPQPQVTSRALALLREVGACEMDDCTLTPLGHHLAALPVNVRIGKMLLFGAIFGCLEQVAVIAAAITDKSPFQVPLNKKDLANTAKQAMAVACSDHLTLYRAYDGWKKAKSQGRQAEMKYCHQNFLKRNTLLDIENVKQDLVKLVNSIGFTEMKPKPSRKTAISKSGVLDIGDTSVQGHGLDLETIAVLKAVLTAGLYPCVAKTTSTPAVDAAANPTKVICVAETAQGMAQIHPASVNRFLQANGWLIYLEKVRLSRVYLRDSTLTSPYPLLLFGGDIDVQHTQQLVSVDGWIKFKTKARTGVIFKELRCLLVQLLQKKLESPSVDFSDSCLIDTIRRLLAAEKS
ncbi:ATP-dependent RNA helicase DHX29-like [Gigantopelta aegis]|uniref:ATP-dependent RNA helicase DHX29-like n=1 Tax=Gigantopelta aegis TaxID=1735272 RepID=UPI001B88DBED|nr:ATP-dependent RNA helicase DHX29-like [Gigantopelta aegis]